VELGNALGLNVIAECVETEEQFGALVAMHCDFLQGFLFGAAQPAECVGQLLQTGWDGRPLRAARH
jgi:EAL domain-containing protein (putative c-di-GMP-specific phosphodiesterase class I)